ncbi:positive regulation of extrinsic apoptotic signaling pathway via death domain receptors protein [Branchiostoma belcheri]|nr:positive regulation of extrinsic apoptotic signaling pathway via death domain receptors protein [Branchiostoma belcheri]
MSSRELEESGNFTPLHKAALRGHVGVAEFLLKAGAQVDSRDRSGDSPLHKAASGGHVGVAELLLKAGAQVDSRDVDKDTSLHCAALRGHVGIVELLLKAGAQVDSRDQDDDTPLHNAATVGHVGVVELLLKAGAQVDSRNRKEDKPLHHAADRGHVGVAELLLKAGAQVDSRNERGETPEDIATSTDVPPWYDKDRVLEGRKKILELFAAERAGRLYRCKVGPKGGAMKTPFCTVSAPGGAVTMETEITCQVVNPNDVTLPLKDGEMLVSDVIELGPHGTTFHKPVTVQMQYNSKSLDGATEAVVWTTEDRSQWKELETITLSEGKLSVSVDHFSIFAVISQPKQDKFTVPTEGFKLTSSTQPAVQISFPEQAVTTPTQVTVQVQEVPKRAVEDIKAKDESFVNLVGTSPIVNVETVSTSEVQFHKPVTVRVPHPQHYMDIQHEGPTKLRVMSCEEGTEDWVDVTDNVTISRVTEEFVEFEVTHFTRWIVMSLVDRYGNEEVMEPFLSSLCKWLQQSPVQFLLLQQVGNMKHVVIECTLAGDAEKKGASLIQKGYTGPLPSESVGLFEGQKVLVTVQGNVSVAPFSPESGEIQHLTFHSQRIDNRLHMQVMALADERGQRALDGEGYVVFHALPLVEVLTEEDRSIKRRITFLRKAHDKKGNPQAPDVLEGKLLCQLPIHVPHHPPTLSSEGAVGGRTLKGVGKNFYFIKENVSKDWKDLAFHLGFEGADIANIAGRNRDDKSCCMDMLQEWKKKKGDAATMEVLMEALSEAGLQSEDSTGKRRRRKQPSVKVTDTYTCTFHQRRIHTYNTATRTFDWCRVWLEASSSARSDKTTFTRGANITIGKSNNDKTAAILVGRWIQHGDLL